MKKLFLAVSLMVMSASAFAQHGVGQFTIAPKLGMNIADLTKTDGESDLRIGLAVGAEFGYQATDMLEITAGALYSMQGCKVDGYDATIKLDYINVPILANVYVAKGLAVKLGVQPGFNVNASAKAKGEGVSVEEDFDAKTLDFSIPVGLSYEFSNVVIDARYNWGLTKVASDSDCKNSVFQITVGYKFDL